MCICAGDCDGDGDCRGDLVCYQRDSEDEVVPGCGDGGITMPEGTWDYCAAPEGDSLDENGLEYEYVYDFSLVRLGPCGVSSERVEGIECSLSEGKCEVRAC